MIFTIKDLHALGYEKAKTLFINAKHILLLEKDSTNKNQFIVKQLSSFINSEE